MLQAAAQCRRFVKSDYSPTAKRPPASAIMQLLVLAQNFRCPDQDLLLPCCEPLPLLPATSRISPIRFNSGLFQIFRANCLAMPYSYRRGRCTQPSLAQR